MQPKIVDRFPQSLVEDTRSRDFIVLVNVVFRNWPELMRNVNASCVGIVIMDIIMLLIALLSADRPKWSYLKYLSYSTMSTAQNPARLMISHMYDRLSWLLLTNPVPSPFHSNSPVLFPYNIKTGSHFTATE